MSNPHSLIRFFTFEHLPPDLRAVSERFAELAQYVDANLSGPEATAGMRKLLEAKDCAVRAALDKRQQEG